MNENTLADEFVIAYMHMIREFQPMSLPFTRSH